MSAQDRIAGLYHEQVGPAEDLSLQASVNIEAVHLESAGWPEARTGLLAGQRQQFIDWLGDLAAMRRDVGLRRHWLALAWLIISWRRGALRRPLTVRIVLRSVAYLVAIVALTLVITARRAARWSWRNRRLILALSIFLLLVTALILGLVQLSNWIESQP